MMVQTNAIIVQACNAMLELKTGELAQHVGAAYDNWEQRIAAFNGGTHNDSPMLRDVLTELHVLGFKW